MTPTSSASCAEAPSGSRRERLRGVRLVAGVAFLGSLAAAVAWRGVFLSRDWLFAWVLLALLVVSLDDLRRWGRGVVFDWLPLMAVLLFYDLSDAVRQLLGIRPHVLPQLQADLVLPGAEVPTVALQRALFTPANPHWYDFAVFAVYLSHFVVTLAALVVLWRRAHARFLRLRLHVAVLATAGFVTYVLFPAVPPWLAAYEGHIPEVHRLIGQMWAHIGLAPAMALWQTNDAFYNDVAALPSLHAAYPALLLLFFWGAGRAVRLGLGTYVLAMGFALVYGGEHYVSDIVVGWAYAGGCFAAVQAARGRCWGAGTAGAPAPVVTSAYDQSREPARAST